MESSKPAVDLEKELTCSICADILYQPLTLLDCLHTFCGACVKEWFNWQAAAAENARPPPPPDSPIFTCPSCRAQVRDTKHNATVATLLDMLLTAQPDKRKPAAEKAEMDSKYKRGDPVLPVLRIAERTPEQQRLDEQERRLIDEVRAMSLQASMADAEASRRAAQHRSSSRQARSSSRDSRRYRAETTNREPSSSNMTDADRMRYERRERSAARREGRSPRLLQPESSEHQWTRLRNEQRQRSADRAAAYASLRRPIEHQSSIRSLISSSGSSSLDIEREIEAFARQIQEEGLLEGLDLDHVDLSNDDELSRKITEAYRRRHRERSRHDRARRSNASANSRHSDIGASESRSRITESPRSASRPRSRSHTQPHSRSTSATGQPEDRSRPPISNSHHLEVRQEPRQRRRTSSEGRSATVPLAPSQPLIRVSARSQTDLSQSQGQGSGESATSVSTAARPSVSDTRSSSSPTVASTAQMGQHAQVLPFSARIPTAVNSPPSPNIGAFDNSRRTVERADRPPDLDLSMQANFGSSPVTLDGPGSPSALSRPGHQRKGSTFYKEPAITCKRCQREHIEYEIHYNCKICSDGNWNICLDCYRAGKGCLHWFGFGNTAWQKWTNARRAGDTDTARPHMMTAGRFLPPRASPGGADGRRVLTTEDPWLRLQTGTFCVRCFTWTNDCYWRCEVCNEGDWGFCNDCVNQGRCCTHPLLPLGYQPTPTQPQTQTQTPPSSPRSPGRPHSASFSSGVNATTIGSFKALSFKTTCDVCRTAIPPSDHRYHCYTCVSSVSSLSSSDSSKPGDYDICQPCYGRLVQTKVISAENGPAGWRRCPRGGHRMVVVGFQEGRGGQRRAIVRDLVGGRTLKIEPVHNPESSLQRWYVHHANERRYQRLVAKDVAASAAAAPPTTTTDTTAVAAGAAAEPFPPDGGLGAAAVAKWAWYPAPGADDELLFPKMAEIREIEDMNGEWFFGVYMGAKGLFPSGYVKMLPRPSEPFHAVTNLSDI